MQVRRFFEFVIIAAAAGAAACSSPAQPTPVVGGALNSTPSDGAQIAFASQPVTLVAVNASVTGGTNVTLTFEVASDSSFATKVQTKQVAQSSSAQTSVLLDPLTSGKDYYWHVRAQAGNTTGVFSATSKFTIVPFTPPVIVSPNNGAVVGSWPTLVVNDVQSAGQTGPLMYRFDVSTSSAFDAIVASGTVPETPGQTSYTPNVPLPGSQQTVYWRATATDSVSGASSSASSVGNFQISPSAAARIAAQEGIALWPDTQPSGSPGHAVLGDNWGVGQRYYAPTQTYFLSPTAEMLRLFDLVDRGYDVQTAINWMNSNGYRTIAYWYPPPEKAVIGLQYVYIACIPPVSYPSCGRWDLVVKVE
jgi:hypothetical protein